MIKPVNGHLLIEPLTHESFVASQKDQYDEIGTVVDRDLHLTGVIEPGDKVYFDSWLAAKYPKNDREFYWLVKWEDVRAADYAEPTVPK
jgi:co-chaperonin GroES (HSP10)